MELDCPAFREERAAEVCLSEMLGGEYRKLVSAIRTEVPV
jgi:hypothetical protein